MGDVVNLRDPRPGELQYQYYIAYGIAGAAGTGFGSCYVRLSLPICGADDIQMIEDLIAPGLPAGMGATILSWQLLTGPGGRS